MNTLSLERRAQLVRLAWLSLSVGISALFICGLGALISPTQFFRAYLVSYLFFLGIGHGCFLVLMIYHLTGGAWGFLIRRVLEAGTKTLLLLAFLFLPIAFGVNELYEWAQPAMVDMSKSLQHKQIYLNVPFFWARAFCYFAVWLGFAHFLYYWSRKQDRAADPREAAMWTERLAYLSGPGLVVFGITITFAVVDWLMSLQTEFRSTIFGPLFASGELLSGFACALIVLAWLVARPPLRDVISKDALNDLGSLLFTFLIIWAYMTFFQFMLIWIADLPYDVLWYIPRTHDGWQWVALGLLILHFIIPFFLLLMRDIKRNPQALALLAGLILVMHLIYMYYQVLPAFPASGIADHWMDFVAPFGIGGVWLAYFLHDLKDGPILPSHDVNEESALHLHELDREYPEAHHA